MREYKLSGKILKNPLIILESEDILMALKKHWIINHENLGQSEKFVEDFFAYLKQDMQDKISKRKINKFYKKKLKEYQRQNFKLEIPGDMFLEIINKHLAGIETILDFGCGKLTLLKNLSEQNSSIKKLIGVDLKSQPDLEKLDSRIEFMRNLESIRNASVDMVIVKLVLHHLRDNEEAKNIFLEIRRVLRPSGKLIVFEESFLKASRSAIEGHSMSIKNYLAKVNLGMAESTRDFMRLTQAKKIKFLFLNDWLMNLQNSYMPWTGLYKSMDGWIELIEASGFQKQTSHFLGAIKHRKRKQGMTAIMIFEK